MTTKRRLLNVKGISEAKVDKIKEAIAKVAVRWTCILHEQNLPDVWEYD